MLLLHHLIVSSSLCHEAITVTFHGNLNDDTGLALQALTVCVLREDPIYIQYMAQLYKSMMSDAGLQSWSITLCSFLKR